MSEPIEKPERTDAEWAELRKTKKARDAAENELSELRRTLAFRDAGIDENDAQMRYFVKGYDGPVDADSIRQTALEAGFIQEAARQEQSEAVQQAGAVQERVAGLSSGATPENDQQLVSASRRLNEAMQAGGQEALIAQLQSEGLTVQFE